MKHAPKNPYSVVGIGEILWDRLPSGKQLGGAPANFTFHSHSLGAVVSIISCIGHDNDGEEIRQVLTQKGVVTDYLYRNDHPTGRVNVKIDINGHPTYIIEENVAWDFIQLCLKTTILAKSCDAVCFGSLAQRTTVSHKAIHQFLSQTSHGCLRIFDINLRQNFISRKIIERSLQAANVVKMNKDELQVLQEMLSLPLSVESALKTLMGMYGLQCIALTQGADGSILMNRESIVHTDGIHSTIKDTIGAGDAFTAAMTIGLLRGFSLDKINRMAEKVAAYVCSQAGATPDLPEDLLTEFNSRPQQTIKEISTKSRIRKSAVESR